MKTKPTYTRAEPVSLCATIIAMGTMMTAAVARKCFMSDILNPDWLMTVASISDVAILESSAGWKLTGPNENHDLEPLTSVPRKITAISRRIVKP